MVVTARAAVMNLLSVLVAVAVVLSPAAGVVHDLERLTWTNWLTVAADQYQQMGLALMVDCG